MSERKKCVECGFHYEEYRHRYGCSRPDETNPPAPSRSAEVDAWAKKHGIGSKEEFLSLPGDVYSSVPTVNDERDAEAAAIDFYAEGVMHGKEFKTGFLAGRKSCKHSGMVPAAEVGRLKVVLSKAWKYVEGLLIEYESIPIDLDMKQAADLSDDIEAALFPKESK